MRNLSATSLAKITQQYGAEPITIVSVFWRNNEYFYAEKWINEDIPGKLLRLDNIESVTTLNGSGSGNSLNILLDDTDGSLKKIFDTIDIHRRIVNVYQWFDGIAFDEKFIIYEGVIESPIVYSDNDRTLSFAVVTINEHQEIGFSPEEGQFPNLPLATVGQAWPMCFGSPTHVPGLTYQYPATATLLNPVLVLAPALDVIPPNQGTYKFYPGYSEHKWEAVSRNSHGAQGEIVLTPPLNNSGDLVQYQQVTANIARAGKFGISDALASAIDDFIPDMDEFGNIPPPGESSFLLDGKEYDEHDYALVENGRFAFDRIDFTPAPKRVIQPNESAYYYVPGVQKELKLKGTRTDGAYLLNGGIGLPIGVWMELTMSNHLFRGYLGFDGFLQLKKINLPGPVKAYYSGSSEDLQPSVAPQSYEDAVNSTGQNAQKAFNIMQNTTYFTPDGTLTIEEYADPKYRPHFDRSGQVSVGYRLQQGIQSDGFQVYNAGTEIRIIGDYSIDYIVNIFPCVVTQVWGYRSINNVKTLVPVSTDRWEQVAVNFGTVVAQIVRLKRMLSLYPGETWEDGIYVDVTSSIGPNPVDIMKDIITLYCPDMSYDVASFDAARPKLAEYPMNFYIAEKPEVLSWLQEIAYQCRAAIYIKDATFYLKYLSEEPTPCDTITRDDIIEGTIQVSTTDTEDLVTRLTGTYQTDYARNDVLKIIKRNNIVRYGLFKDEHNFFAFDDFFPVHKTVSYWIIIRSNVWKRVSFSTPLHKLNLETLDNIIFDVPGVVANVPVNCRIESTSFDQEKNQIDFQCWVPVRLGEMIPYPLAYPADAEVDFVPLRLLDFAADQYRDFRQFNQGFLSTVPGQQAGNPATNVGRDSLSSPSQSNSSGSAAQSYDGGGNYTNPNDPSDPNDTTTQIGPIDDTPSGTSVDDNQFKPEPINPADPLALAQSMPDPFAAGSPYYDKDANDAATDENKARLEAQVAAEQDRIDQLNAARKDADKALAQEKADEQAARDKAYYGPAGPGQTDLPNPGKVGSDKTTPPVFEDIIPPDQAALAQSLDLPVPPGPTEPDAAVYGRRKPVELNPLPSPGSIPGKVIGRGSAPGVDKSGGNGSWWQVQIWRRGLTNPSDTITAQQLQIDPTDDIPAGTSVLVSMTCTNRESDGDMKLTYNYEYTMQLPVWLT